MNNKPRILFTATFSTPFIQEDLQTLRSQYTVIDIISSGIGTFWKYLAAVGHCDMTFSWFASVYSSLLVLMGKLWGKKSIIILGGVDVAKEKEYNYGIWNSRWKSVLVRYGIKHADAVLAVDASLKHNAITLAGYPGENITVVPTGYDPTFWIPGTKQERIVLTVAHCTTIQRVKVKGIDFLFAVARTLPDVSFVLIGTTADAIASYTVPANIALHGYLDQPALRAMYQQAKVYFQPSRREGLPNTLCEAMLCGCYPVGTNVGGIPTAIGDTGAVVPVGDVEEAAKQIRNGLQTDLTHSARERIITQFSKTQREQQLMRIIADVMHG